MESIDAFTVMRFNKDQRLREVRKLLSSAEMMIIDIKDTTLSDAMLLQAQKQQLMIRIQCCLALPIGRGLYAQFILITLIGMFTMGMQRGTQPIMTETVEIPPINLIGRVKGTSQSVNLELEMDSPIAKALFSWPYFHNGVSVGLRIGRDQVSSLLFSTYEF